ncbi:hypothetical protein [Psychrobacter sp. JCM 18900]|nr:hypothetical protein [Psychrobacter sp. JCM 18900]
MESFNLIIGGKSVATTDCFDVINLLINLLLPAVQRPVWLN